MRRPTISLTCVTLSCLAGAVGAQSPRPPAGEQIAAAVLPLPAELRSAATVMGYDGSAKLSIIRKGSNGMTCLAADPNRADFHVACYHESMEPFMARGRELRAQGNTDAQVDSVRYAEAKSGMLSLPKQPASLYSLTGPKGSFDAVSGEAKATRRLFVVYIPYATEASTGLSTQPKAGEPWLMLPGTPKAHIMFVPSMR
ncbi:MAG: hypothetical protein ACT4R6_12950 [Gemmatimonadaceae bacterium]